MTRYVEHRSLLPTSSINEDNRLGLELDSHGAIEVNDQNIHTLADAFVENAKAEEMLKGLAESINTKAFTATRELINAVHFGKITEEQFGTGIDALFTALSGIVNGFEPVSDSIDLPFTTRELPPTKWIDLITSCQEECKNIYPLVKRVFFNGKMTKVFQWQAGDSHISLSTLSETGIETRRVECETAVKARDKLAAMASGPVMAQFGYREI